MKFTFDAITLWTIMYFVQIGMLTSSSVVSANLTADNHAANIQTPVFTGGTISCGTKSVWRKTGWPYILMCIDNDAICTLGESIDLGKGNIDTVFFMNPKNELIENGSFFSADVRDATSSEKKLGKYKVSMNLIEDGLIRIESSCILDDSALLKNRYSTFKFPPYITLSGIYNKQGQKVSFDEKSPISFKEEELEGAKIIFFPDSQGKTFTIFPDMCSEIKITSNIITFYPKQIGIISFLLDISEVQTAKDTSELSPNGIDFFKIDNLHLPDYGASRNLISNPSFEAGLRYWGYPVFAHDIIPLKYSSFYEIDKEEVYSGTNSLRIKALSIKNPLPLGPFTIPFVSGKNYTLSFYAKGSVDKNIAVNLWGRGFRQPHLLSGSTATFAVDAQWKRYSTTFVPQDRFGGIYFSAQITSASSEQQEESVWIDDIQLEKGSETDFEHQPIAAQFVSSARGNFLEFGHKPDFNLFIQSQADSEGTVAISVEDFFFKRIYEGTFPFKTDNTGKTSISLDALSNNIVKDNLRGVFIVTGVFNISGLTRPYTDYFRFSVMDFLNNTHKNKNIFNLHYVFSLQAGGPNMERFVKREQQIGFGSITYDFGSFANDLDYDLDRERMELLKKYRIECVGRPVLKLHTGINGEISEQDGSIKMYNIKSRINPTDEELAVFESICAVKAKSRPWNKIWWFTGESNPGVMPLEGHPDAFAKFLLATLRGIKKGNPDAQVLIEGGPWSLSPDHGTKWVERYIQDTKRIDPTARFDGAACHHYRNFPENPDLDSDIAAFLAMLDRNDCAEWPFHVNEGGNYCPFNIPQEGISPYISHSANNWYTGPLSYHIGKSERISAAFTARNWLVALKYHTRVACMQDFSTSSRYVDIDFTPRFYDKIPNTLGRLLGDASFYKDIRFAPYVRCYVFIDDKAGTPIAAIWGHKESVDRWKENAPLYSFDFKGQEIVCIDLMENEVTFQKDSDGRTLIPLSPFPLFIKGMAGTEQQLCDSIAGATASSSDIEILNISAFPNTDGNASVVFKNMGSKDFEGKAKMVFNGTQSDVFLKLAPFGQKEEVIGLQHASKEYGKLLDFDFSCSVDEQITENISGAYMLIKNNSPAGLTVDGNSSDWKNVSAVDIGSGVSVKAIVSDGNLIVAIEAKNPYLESIDFFAGIGLYINPFWKTEQWNLSKVTTQDLAVFEFIKTNKNNIEAFSHYVQGTQAGSGSSYMVQGRTQEMITVKTSVTNEVAFMVFSVPQQILSPLILKPGSRFGLNISVPLKDKDVKKLAQIENFKVPAEPAEIYFVTMIVCD